MMNTDGWSLEFRPGIWKGDDLDKDVPPQGPALISLTGSQAEEAVKFAQDGGYWDDLWSPTDLPGVPQWIIDWASPDPTGTREYDYWLVSPNGDRYTESNIKDGEWTP